MKLRAKTLVRPMVVSGLFVATFPFLSGCEPPRSEDVAVESRKLVASDIDARPGISSRGNNTLDVFTLVGGVAQQRSWNPGWTDWTPVPGQGEDIFFGQTAAVSWDSTRIDLFTTTTNGQIMHTFSNFGSWVGGFEPIANMSECANVPCRLAVTSSGPNDLDVFVMYPSQPSGDWMLRQIQYRNGWQPFTTPALQLPDDGFETSASSIAAVSWGPGRIDLIITQINGGEAFHYWTNDRGASWGGPEGLGSVGPMDVIFDAQNVFNVGISTWGPGVLDVVGAHKGMIARKSYRPVGGWGPWVVETLPTPPPVGSQGTRLLEAYPSTVSWGPDRIDMVSTLFDTNRPREATTEVWHAWFMTSASPDWAGGETL